MQEGWECSKCHNVMAPNIPFCLYCWFQKNENNTPLIINPEPIEQQQEKSSIITKKEIKPMIQKINQQKEILLNKNIELEQINITIPALDKKPEYPLPDKFPDTEIYLAGLAHTKERTINTNIFVPYMLDSINDFPSQPSQLVRKYFDWMKSSNIKFLLDSGAFTYMNNPKKSFNLTDHLKKFCYYINEFDINNFFELDLDVFMTIDEVENIRRKIYLETHKQPIIVFHEERGHDYWINMCKENNYVAIGGLVSSTETNSSARFRRLLEYCDEAHTYNTKVHGLGFTPLQLLNTHTIFFDTVDSTTWNYTKYGKNAAINEKGELIRGTALPLWSASEGQLHDLAVWAEFSINYTGGLRSELYKILEGQN